MPRATGSFPAGLDQITEAPVPLDSGTGKPFSYQVEGEGAILSASYPPRCERRPHPAIHGSLPTESQPLIDAGFRPVSRDHIRKMPQLILGAPPMSVLSAAFMLLAFVQVPGEQEPDPRV